MTSKDFKTMLDSFPKLLGYKTNSFGEQIFEFEFEPHFKIDIINQEGNWISLKEAMNLAIDIHKGSR